MLKAKIIDASIAWVILGLGLLCLQFLVRLCVIIGIRSDRQRQIITSRKVSTASRQNQYQETAAMEDLKIRNSVLSESDVIESLYPDAFPDENLLPLVRDLLQDSAVATSLVGVINARIVGHAIFTKCGVVGSNLNMELLGPLAIAPAWQRQGIGSAIVRAGLKRLEETDVNLVFVLGDPAYYKRLGFLPESLIEPPFRLPVEWNGAWQSQYTGNIKAPFPGKLSVPRQWLQSALWAP